MTRRATTRILRAGAGAFVAALAGAALVTALPAPDPAVAAPHPYVHVRPMATFASIRLGDRGARVTLVQQRLKALGFRATVNGKFGPATKAAVLAFQRSRRLATDGVVGARTWHALGLDGSATTPTVPPTSAPTTTLPPTTVPVGPYHHPNPNVERWHAVALAQGWAEQDWKHLSCVIQRESKGNPNAYNASTASGLLQIVYRAHKAWIGTDPNVLFDGATNLRMGYRMFHDVGWRPWSGSITICSK
jgi:hypothetical protein